MPHSYKRRLIILGGLVLILLMATALSDRPLFFPFFNKKPISPTHQSAYTLTESRRDFESTPHFEDTFFTPAYAPMTLTTPSETLQIIPQNPTPLLTPVDLRASPPKNWMTILKEKTTPAGLFLDTQKTQNNQWVSTHGWVNYAWKRSVLQLRWDYYAIGSENSPKTTYQHPNSILSVGYTSVWSEVAYTLRAGLRTPVNTGTYFVSALKTWDAGHSVQVSGRLGEIWTHPIEAYSLDGTYNSLSLSSKLSLQEGLTLRAKLKKRFLSLSNSSIGSDFQQSFYLKQILMNPSDHSARFLSTWYVELGLEQVFSDPSAPTDPLFLQTPKRNEQRLLTGLELTLPPFRADIEVFLGQDTSKNLAFGEVYGASIQFDREISDEVYFFLHTHYRSTSPYPYESGPSSGAIGGLKLGFR